MEIKGNLHEPALIGNIPVCEQQSHETEVLSMLAQEVFLQLIIRVLQRTRKERETNVGGLNTFTAAVSQGRQLMYGHYEDQI